ncbi:pectinesterase family protein [Hymenobacter cellulosilyticus]|uniref:pectinesterase family protein n=1 Tax=Hymenobacter cellulosilyticus TaxID=2932248 RepID=UPI0021D4505F|nr:pectinesterase family protein [Hymenobacter cellulosilyticus]
MQSTLTRQVLPTQFWVLVGFFLFAFPFGSFAQVFDMTVAQDGTGNYTTVQAAINAAPTGRTTPFTIFITNGTYRERVTIPANKPFLQLIGESVANTRIAFNLANVPSFPGNTSTVIINASDITAVNITFENFWESPRRPWPCTPPATG